MAITTATIAAIHSGDKTHHHDQFMTFVNFSATNSMATIEGIKKEAFVFHSLLIKFLVYKKCRRGTYKVQN